MLGYTVDMKTKETWPTTLTDRQNAIASAIIEGEAAIDRLCQIVGTDDFTGDAADMLYKFEQATRDGEPEADEWAAVIALAEKVIRK